MSKNPWKKAPKEMLRKKAIYNCLPNPKPKRIQLGERIFDIIQEEVIVEATKERMSISSASGRATERILKIVQNNYRRRVY